MAASGKSIPPADAAAPQTRIRIALTVLRAAIGWHFLYEGLIKLADPTWTAAEYLRMSRWALADFFQWIADTPSALALVDWLNVWGLILIGAGLLFGALARTASVCGALLLLFYYAAYPAFGDFDFGQAREGHYYIVNKTLVEMLALLALAFLPARSSYGVDGLIRWGWARIRAKADPPAIARSESETDAPPPAAAPETKGRRELLANLISLPVIGGLALAALKRSGWRIYEEDALAAKPDALSGATIKIFNFSSLQELKTETSSLDDKKYCFPQTHDFDIRLKSAHQ